MRRAKQNRAAVLASVSAALLVGATWSSAPALAAVPARTVVEVDAAVPAGADAKSGGAVRQQVVEEGIRQAVREVANTYADPGAPSRLETQLGGTSRDYVLGYRILETMGERPARILRGRGGPKTEYAARIEVSVDTRRVAAALTAAGLRTPETHSGVAPAGQFLLEPPLRWPAWTRLQKALLAAGAERVVPDRITAEGMTVHIVGPSDPGRLLESVQRNPPSGLVLESVRGTAPVRVRARVDER